MKILISAVLGLLAAAALAAPVRADQGSYLDYLHQRYPGETAGLADHMLLFGGAKACAGDRNSAPGMPALSAAVWDAAHRELCP
jgi:hypothetical protein